MNRRPVRLCMLGAGAHAARNIYPYFYHLAGKAEIVANCDLDLAKAGEIGSRFAIERHYDDLERMLETERPDGVIVCTGAAGHYQLALRIMRHGAHVYVEKPHCATLAQSREMLDVAIAEARICMSAYKKRFSPSYVKARDLFASGEMGAPTYLQLMRTMGGGRTNKADYLWEWGSHGTDLAAFLFGEVAEVHAFRSRGAYEAVSANLQFRNGAAGNTSLCSPGGAWEEVTMLGEGMKAVRISNTVQMTVYEGNVPSGGHYPSWIHGYNSSGVEMGYVGELLEFAEAITDLRQPESQIAQSTHTIALHEAIMRSLETGKVEAVPSFAIELPQPRSAYQ